MPAWVLRNAYGMYEVHCNECQHPFDIAFWDLADAEQFVITHNNKHSVQ